MKDNVSCPFCGISFEPFVDRATASHPIGDGSCTLDAFEFSIDQWNKRPPRKEQPAMPVAQNEVMWLRMLVEDFIDMKVVNITLPNGVKVSEGKE